jgi:excinuclease ABC subunit C
MNIASKLKHAPAAPGIYLFYSRQRVLIYVGKATNLHSRIRSYFVGQKSPRPIESFISEIARIRWIKTDSVLEAILLEAKYIKQFQPKYNVLGKDDKSWNYLCLTKESFPKLIAVREHDLASSVTIRHLRPISPMPAAHVFGPFPGLNAQATLKLLRRLFAYSTCEPNAGKSCFYRQINQCLGVCTGEINRADYRRKVVAPLAQFLSGRKRGLLKALKKQMHAASSSQNFEEAARLRNQIFNLQRIQDIALISSIRPVSPIGHIPTIEGYDISNLGSSDKVGSLVVFKSGEPVKSEYKKFKIKTVTGQSDVACLTEVLTRRLKHKEWPLPNIILVDGGKPQLSAARGVLRNAKVNIPIVGIAKGSKRKKNEFFTSDKQIISWIKENKQTLIRVRDEAHRFAVKYQRQLRKIP